MVWHCPIDVEAGIFDIALIIVHDRAHEFEECISNFNVINLVRLLIDVHQHFEEGIVDVVQVWMRTVVDTRGRSHQFLPEYFVLTSWHLGLLRREFTCA